jgi:hypothetical protein
VANKATAKILLTTSGQLSQYRAAPSLFRRLSRELHLTFFPHGKTANVQGSLAQLEVNSYEKKSASQSAFFNPRVLIGFVLCSIGVSLALVGRSKSATGNPVLITGMSATTMTAQTPGTWAATGSMTTARAGSTATLLDNGKILVAGGSDASGNVIASAELYDPGTGT